MCSCLQLKSGWSRRPSQGVDRPDRRQHLRGFTAWISRRAGSCPAAEQARCNLLQPSRRPAARVHTVVMWSPASSNTCSHAKTSHRWPATALDLIAGGRSAVSLDESYRPTSSCQAVDPDAPIKVRGPRGPDHRNDSGPHAQLRLLPYPGADLTTPTSILISASRECCAG